METSKIIMALETATLALLSIVEKYDSFEKENPGVSNPIPLSVALKATKALNEIKRLVGG